MKKKKFRNPFDKRNNFQQEKRNIFTFLKYKINIRFTYVYTIGKFTKNIYLKVVKNATNISYNEIKCNDAKCKKKASLNLRKLSTMQEPSYLDYKCQI